MSKNFFKSYLLWFIVSLSVILFICFNFFCIGDDLSFAKSFASHSRSIQEIITVKGVNGRYLGNTLGLVFSYLETTSLKIIKVLFDFIFIVSLIFLSSEIASTEKSNIPKAFFYISIGILSANCFHYVEIFSYSAGFMNYLVPIVILFTNYKLVRRFILFPKKSLIVISCFLAFINCFFIEHITVYLTFICFVFFVYSIISKKYMSASLPLFLSSAIGMVCMFLYPIIYPNTDIGYHQSVFSNGVMWAVNNIFENSRLVIFDHIFLTLFLSAACFLTLCISCKNKSTVKKFPAVIITLILALGCACSLFNYFGNWENTVFRVLTLDYFITFETIAFLIAVGLTVLFYLPKSENNFEIYAIYLSVCFICCMLSVVSPLGPRCFLIVFVFLNILAARILLIVSSHCHKLINTLTVIAFLTFFAVYMPMICKSFYNGNKVQKERFEYISEQMNKNVKSVNVPGSINFTDAGGLRFMEDYFYYECPGDLEINFVPYEEWDKIR